MPEDPSTDPASADSTLEPARAGGWWRTFTGLPRPVRVSAWVAAGLVVVLIAALVTVTAYVRRPLPAYGGELDVAGLEAPVRVVRDEHGIPQLYGDSMADLMRAQGFVHAQERFYEMDVRRHITAGRLSELFGETTVETDRVIRTMGWRDVASRELALLEPETRAALQDYADGVNAYLEDRAPSEIAVEYTVLRAGGLRYVPQEWTPVDSLAWLKAMAWDLRGNMQEEIARVLARVDHTAEEVAQLFPAYSETQNPPIVGTGAVVDGVFDQEATGGTRNPRRAAPGGLLSGAGRAAPFTRVSEAIAQVPALVGRGDALGSNAWVVGGERSGTGAPILANDPHLGISLPGIWMQMGLHCNEVSAECPLDVAGFTFSGVPGVIIGHNADIAWGFTNLGPDVTDLYLERTRGDQWRYDRRWRELRTREETIEVFGGDDVTFTVRESDHGPLLSEALEELETVGESARPGERYAVSLSWTALQPSTTADAILALNLAGDWDEFRAAAADFAVPAQNLVYADREGHIGYQAPGLIPIRQSGNDGQTPSAGWRPENDWTGDFVPFNGLPSVLDPEEGFVVTANQAVIGSDYAYYLGSDWDQGYRATRIRERIEGDGRWTVAETADLQLDDRNPMAETLVPYLLDVEGLGSQYYRDGQDLLREWDGTQPAYEPEEASAAAAYFNAVWAALLRLTFHDELPETIWPEGGDRWFAAVTGLLAEPAASWWDDTTTDDDIEDRDTILRLAMQQARDSLTSQLELQAESWRWGDLHQMNLRNATVGESGIAPVEWLVNRGGYATGGGSSIVNATGWDAAGGYEVTSSPSMRMVVSLADYDDSRWINLTGVSGHPGSAHYVDQTELWAQGATLPWAFGREAVDAAAEDTLVLQPSSPD